MARSKLTDPLQLQLVNAIRAGAYLEEAARAYGIAPSTFHSWRQRGNEALAKGSQAAREAPYAAFSLAIDRALAEAEVQAVGVIRAAFKDDWRSAAWYLERRHPDRWRKRQTTEIEGGNPDKPVAVDVEVGEKRVTDAAHDFLRQLAG